MQYPRRLVLRATFVRTFEEACPEYLEEICALMELAYLHSQFAENRAETDVAAKKREERCDAFAGMANGSWRLRCVMHHCKHACCGSWEDCRVQGINIVGAMGYGVAGRR